MIRDFSFKIQRVSDVSVRLNMVLKGKGIHPNDVVGLHIEDINGYSNNVTVFYYEEVEQ